MRGRRHMRVRGARKRDAYHPCGERRGGGGRPRHIIVELAKSRGGTVQGFKYSVTLILCDCAGGSESLTHDEWGVFFTFPV